MVWTQQTNTGFAEADKIAHAIVRYTRGHVLELGAGTHATWPHFTTVDSGKAMNGLKPDNISVMQDCADLSLFGDASWDAVFSSHLLEHFDLKRVPKILKEWSRVLRVGGYLVLYVPSANLYPKAGTPGANDDHKWDIYPDDIEKLLKEHTDCGWTQLEKEERNQGDEYSLFLVFKKREDGEWHENIWQRNPQGKKRALVVRFGAIGDLLQASSILPGLKKQGYHVTWLGHANTAPVLWHNPNIDEWCLHDQDQVPNRELGHYWKSLEERYDRIINLCESVEGGLLQMPGKLQHAYSDEARRRTFGNINYLDRTADIADVEKPLSVKHYVTEDEKEWALKEKSRWEAPVVIWCLTGTSNHKTYPFVDTILKWIAEKTPAVVYLYGDKFVAKALQDAVMECLKRNEVDTSRIMPMCGLWSIRESLAFAQIADIIIGPETGIMNAVGHEKDVAKIIYLSHSSHENLTRDWKNSVVLTPDRASTPCYPCHRLHYDWTFCNKVEDTGAALCATNIKPETIFKEVMKILINKANKLEAAE
jgi:ADP-heptose:LPS heptosyltransferase/predicted SAM-dependent methyltransferase